MRQIVVNECLKVLRKRKRSVPILFEEELRDVEIEEDTGPPEVEKVPAAVIHEMIKELPDGYRAVFNLFVLEEKNHKEISELLGITESTSASQLYRARMILAKKIKEYLGKVKIKR
jgi:RNA polymerase sigma-70 factor (ECF subfamily)